MLIMLIYKITVGYILCGYVTITFINHEDWESGIYLEMDSYMNIYASV